MAKRYCAYEYCREHAVYTMRHTDELDVVLEYCPGHADWLEEMELAVPVGSAEEAELLMDQGNLTCDEPECNQPATQFILWRLDDDDDDEVVGKMCKFHAAVILERGHCKFIESDEALDILIEQTDLERRVKAWDSVWAQLESWAETYDDLEADSTADALSTVDYHEQPGF